MGEKKIISEKESARPRFPQKKRSLSLPFAEECAHYKAPDITHLSIDPPIVLLFFFLYTWLLVCAILGILFLDNNQQTCCDV
jgi:hypothetical protein